MTRFHGSVSAFSGTKITLKVIPPDKYHEHGLALAPNAIQELQIEQIERLDTLL
jgi:hypothetical protein